MAYCRLSDEDSDAYVYQDAAGCFVAVSDRHAKRQCNTRAELLETIQEFRRDGVRVPERVDTKLRTEQQRVGDAWNPPPDHRPAVGA